MSEPAECISGYLAPGTVLGDKYRIDRLIGEGGMGVVYQAYHLVLEQRIAVKVVRPQFAHHSEAIASELLLPYADSTQSAGRGAPRTKGRAP